MTTGKQKCTVQEEAKLIKYMTQEAAAQNIKNQYKSRTESEKIEEPKRK